MNYELNKSSLDEQQALKRLAAECAKGEHSSGEMLQKMQRWGLAQPEQERVLRYLTDNRFVDDERFARMFIRDKMRLNHWGPRKIEQALWAKHIDGTVSRPLLAEVTAEEWAEQLSPLLKTRRKSIKAATQYEADMKLVRFALSRGFTSDVIRRVLGADVEVDEEFCD